MIPKTNFLAMCSYCFENPIVDSLSKKCKDNGKAGDYVNSVVSEDVLDLVAFSGELSFSDIKEADMKTIYPFLLSERSRTTDFSYGGIAMWVDFFNYKFAIFKNTLFLMGDSPSGDGLCFTVPIGELPLTESVPLLKSYCERNSIPLVFMTTEFYLPFIEACCDVKDKIFLEDWREYIYDLNSFATFSGRKLNKKRNHLNYFLNNYTNHLVNQVGSDDIEDLIEFTRDFSVRHDEDTLSRYESEQTILLLKNYSSMPYEGIVIRDGDKVVGFAIGEIIGDTLFTHIEKGDISYRGIYQALAYYFSRFIKGKYPELLYLNREEDVGDESLRKSKLSYHPEFFVEKYLVTI